MGAKSSARKTCPAFCLAALALFILLRAPAHAQEPASSLRLPFTAAEQEKYLDTLIRNAPRDWAHGKNWVLIQPVVLGRNVTQPFPRTVCPDPALADPSITGTEIPPWIYSASGVCQELVTARHAAVVTLEDPKDSDAAYFLFLVCDAKKNRNGCDLQTYGPQNGVKLEESKKGGRLQFDVIAPIEDEFSDKTKTSRFSVAEVWHVRQPAIAPDTK